MTEIKTTTRAPFAVRSGHLAYACFAVFTNKSAVKVEISKAFQGRKCRARMARWMEGPGARDCKALGHAADFSRPVPEAPRWVSLLLPSLLACSCKGTADNLPASLQNLRVRGTMSWPRRPPPLSLFESECRTLPQQAGMAAALQRKRQITLDTGNTVMKYTVLAVGGEAFLEGVLRF